MLWTIIRNPFFIKFALVIVAYFGGYIYGTVTEKEYYDKKVIELENKRLNDILTIERKNTTLVNKVAEKYEYDLSTIKTDYDKLRSDYGRLRVKPCVSLPADTRTASKPDATSANATGNRASDIDFAGIAGKIATIGEQLDKCYKQVDGLQQYIKLIKNGE